MDFPVFATYDRIGGCPSNDEQVHHVDSAGSGLLGDGSPAQQIDSFALVTVGGNGWGCR
jgi:hypothetical protein